MRSKKVGRKIYILVVFINDMPPVVDCFIQLFSDDAKFFDKVNLRDNNNDERLQKDINSLSLKVG